MDRILRIDTGAPGAPRAWTESLGAYVGLGGRAMVARMVSSEVPARCEPLGPENRVVLAPGLLAGADTAARQLYVGCKSPLFPGVEVAVNGGSAGDALARLGFAAVVVQGDQRDEAPWTVHISSGGVRVSRAPEFRHLGLGALSERLRERHGAHVTVLGNGPAGDRGMACAAVRVHRPEKGAALRLGQGGDGAVLGAKGVKAVVLDDTGTPGRSPVRQDDFDSALRGLRCSLAEAAQGGAQGPARGDRCGNDCPGSPKGADGRCAAGAGRYGWPQHSDERWVFSRACGMDDAEGVERLRGLCVEYGLDGVEMGFSLRVAIQAGLLARGDVSAACRLLRETGEGTALGRLFGAGAAAAASSFGVRLGRDDLFDESGDAADGPGKERSEMACRLLMASMALEMAGYCRHLAFATLHRPEALHHLTEAVNALYGLSMSTENLTSLSLRTLGLERGFNDRADRADRAPAGERRRLQDRPLGPLGMLFDNAGALRECAFEVEEHHSPFFLNAEHEAGDAQDMAARDAMQEGIGNV
jgi:aldehyde:ferredoxin oxidoreductase